MTDDSMQQIIQRVLDEINAEMWKNNRTPTLPDMANRIAQALREVGCEKVKK